jgi:hypothetical protein
MRLPQAGGRETGTLKASDARRHDGEIDDERFQYPEGDSGTYGALFWAKRPRSIGNAKPKKRAFMRASAPIDFQPVNP